MSIFGFGGGGTQVDIQFDDDKPDRKSKTLTDGDKEQIIPIYEGHETIKGSCSIKVAGKKVEHLGVKVELIGLIELWTDRTSSEFTSRVLELAAPGVLQGETDFKFNFDSDSVEKEYESYRGLNACLRYFVRVTVTRQYSSNIVKEKEFWIQNLGKDPEIDGSIKMEVGIEDCLHIEFEYNKQKYHLKDTVLGKIYFLLVRIKIKYMEIAIIRRESTGSGAAATPASDTISKFEVMDGAPVRGESIPVRLFLASSPLTPTYKSVNNKFTTRYYLNLVLVDEEDRRYFKQQEIVMWRKEIG